MRTKRYISLILAALMLTALTACGAEKDKEESTSMSIQPAQLSEEETALIQLLGLEMKSYRIFDFQVSGAQSIRPRAYELVDGEWNCVVDGAFETADSEGRIALTFGKMTDGVRMACKNGGGIFSREFVMEADDTSGMAFVTSALTSTSTVELDQEIPLILQFATSKSEFNSYDVDYFGMPRELAKSGYEHVYAITVTFSAKELSELLDAPVPPSSDPTEPMPED